MAIALRATFTPVNTGSATAAPVITVPAGVVSTDLIVIAANFITGSAITVTPSTSGSGTLTQQFGNLEGTSADAFVFTGTGFVAGDTITLTPSVANRSVVVGVAYSGAAFEAVGTAGATSTTVANSPSVTAANVGDLAISASFGIASATGQTFSSLSPVGWTARTSQQGGSGTRFQIAELSDFAVTTAGATGAMTATSSGTMLASTGVQLVLSATGGGVSAFTGWGIPPF